MKRIYTLILFFAFLLTIHAQNLAVQSFRMDETDLTANTAGTTVIDQNGQKCALIKVETTQQGFSFDAGSLGVVKTEQHVGEIWVYVPEGVKRITISHQQLGILRDYDLGQTLKRAKTYIMKLTAGEVQTIVKQARTSQYVVFQLQPKNAVVELDGNMLSTQDGMASRMMPFGTYGYRVQAPDYLPEAGKVTVNDPKQKHIVNVKLKPNFSQVTLTADNNAEIWINGTKRGEGSWTGNLGAGTYELETRLPNHRAQTVSRQIEVTQEPQTIHLQAPIPIYGEADITSSPIMADIYIDNVKHGQTPQLIEQLLIGQHQIRLSRNGYADYNGTVTIRDGETTPFSATLSNATSITVSSTNPNATLYIDGVEQGKASGNKQTSYGQHQVRLVDEGWREYTGTINVTEQQKSFSFTMEEIVPSRRVITVGDVSFTMIRVEGGTFQMGATSEQQNPDNNHAKPVHQVKLSSYYIGETEVTQELWQAVMGRNPSHNKGNSLPVEQVSWKDCQKFIKKLNQLTGLKFRLPTEAEWEFAARGGNNSKGYEYSGSNTLDNVAWCWENSGDSRLSGTWDWSKVSANNCKTHPVASRQANELGIFDMSGNVFEICQDWYDENYYKNSPTNNPTGPTSGSFHVARGGCYGSISWGCCSSARMIFSFESELDGLRLCL
jgi:formylglycine-generating enzyme required for sulfatase activity